MMSSAIAAAMSAAGGVVFDKDGTLVDLDARWVPVFRALITALAERCSDPRLVADLETSLGIDGQCLLPDGAAAVDTLEQIVDRLVAVLVERGLEHPAARQIVESTIGGLGDVHGPIEPIGDLVGSLSALRAAGLSIGVATSDDRANTVAELTELGIVDLVDTLRCADDGGPTKPDPQVLSGIADEWAIGVGALVFVGDSRNDMATALAAGCPFVGRFGSDSTPTWAAKADAVIESIDQLVLR